MSRFVVSPPHLYAILDREFRAQRPAACDQCRVPLPFWREPPDEVSANWEVGTPAFCKHGCHLVFAELLTLTNRIEGVASNLDIAPPSLRLTSPGRAVVVAKLDEWSYDGKATDGWRQVGLVLEPAREILATLESAVRKPAYDDGFDYDKGFVDFQLAPVAQVRRSCQILSLSVLYALKQGNLEAAHKHLMALVMLSAKQTPEPLIICQLIRQACAALAFNATWQALQAGGQLVLGDEQPAVDAHAGRPVDHVNDRLTPGRYLEEGRGLTAGGGIA